MLIYSKTKGLIWAAFALLNTHLNTLRNQPKESYWRSKCCNTFRSNFEITKYAMCITTLSNYEWQGRQCFSVPEVKVVWCGTAPFGKIYFFFMSSEQILSRFEVICLIWKKDTPNSTWISYYFLLCAMFLCTFFILIQREEKH